MLARLRNMMVIIFCLYLMPVSVSGAETKPVRIGATVSLEGKYSEPSAMIQGGYKLWESQVNKRGGLLGRPVQLILLTHYHPRITKPQYLRKGVN